MNHDGTIRGEVVYLFAFDVAYDMQRRPLTQLLSQPVSQFIVDPSKRSPRQFFFYRPQMVRLPALEKFTSRGAVTLSRTIKLVPVGALSISVRVGFEVDSIEELVDHHDLHFTDGTRLADHVRELAEEVQRELKHYFIRAVPKIHEEEAYTVFCIAAPADQGSATVSAEQWFLNNRRSIASLLTEERRTTALSEQEARESSAKYFSYYQNDLVVVDWDAALVVDDPRNFDEVVYVMELANVQLAELEAYDRLLDDAVELSYRDLSTRRRIRSWRTTQTQRQLRELRIDLARLSDELSNITKFFGDWHLARIYAGLAERFHLADWHRTIDEKLRALDNVYQLLRTDQVNRWMIFLEAAIVVLILFEIVKSFLL
jgi:hypothetical protein